MPRALLMWQQITDPKVHGGLASNLGPATRGLSFWKPRHGCPCSGKTWRDRADDFRNARFTGICRWQIFPTVAAGQQLQPCAKYACPLAPVAQHPSLASPGSSGPKFLPSLFFIGGAHGDTRKTPAVAHPNQRRKLCEGWAPLIFRSNAGFPGSLAATIFGILVAFRGSFLLTRTKTTTLLKLQLSLCPGNHPSLMTILCAIRLPFSGVRILLGRPPGRH